MLTVDRLEARDTPAPLVASAFAPGYAAAFGFVGAVQDAWGGAPGVEWHALAGLSAGNGPRVVVLSGDGVVASFAAFEDSFRGGVVIETLPRPGGDRLLVGAGVGGAPIVRQFDPLTGTEAGPPLLLGDPAVDRQGVGYLSAFGGRAYAMLAADAGPKLVGFDPDTADVVTSVYVGPADDRSGLYRPAPAGLGVAPGPHAPPAVLVEYGGDPLTARLLDPATGEEV